MDKFVYTHNGKKRTAEIRTVQRLLPYNILQETATYFFANQRREGGWFCYKVELVTSHNKKKQEEVKGNEITEYWVKLSQYKKYLLEQVTNETKTSKLQKP